MTESDRTLTAEEAARVLFSTATPTDQQVGRVRRLLVRGHLKPGAKGRWSTTAQSVAELLASKVAQRRDAGRAFAADGVARLQRDHSTAKNQPNGGPAAGASGELSSLYGQLLRDYFLAVTLRRRVPRRSATFARAVLAGQIALLLAAGGLFVFAGSKIFAPPPAEQSIVEKWLEENTGDFQIVEWFPAQSGGEDDFTQVRVRYKYFSGGRKGIVTDRVFSIEDGRVSGVTHFE